ncbi:glucose-1-phosphate adenylyltransferase subunit GlgD [Paenibacillus thermoaerophilus]|uniref:Glucose-1-phosphate adenylyltransferase subunit GlgD n=1 Tax=Paenibacillus thermoaerophilus TaxID=1215385 RepID=A0ABW2UYL9_9BACL|nr:glucose-1-phosphate adenylyltransferase subunit GlgD [Paenibacillus thermoaerophilus]
MNEMMGVINLINERDHMEELTYRRCVASVPFGGRYRLIDFVMSGMVNSGIDNVAVFAHTKYRSLMDHLGSGKEWDLDRKRGGLFLLPPALDETREIMKGDLYHFYSHRDYFYRSKEPYVVVARSHMVCNVDLRAALEFHKSADADITMLYGFQELDADARCRRLLLDENSRVIDMQDHSGRLESPCISMEMLILKKDLLLDLVETSLGQGYDHFVRDAVMKNIRNLNIYGYRHSGFLGVVNTLQSYYRNSLRLLNPETWRDLFFRPGLIYTKIKDEPPAKYGPFADVHNSLIANGCVIEGTVENSILFRGVRVRKGAVVRNSIVMQNGDIREKVSVENAILDKEVLIRSNRMLRGEEEAPFIAVKRKII